MFIHLLTPRGLTWTRNGVPKTDEAHDRLIAEKQLARPEDLCRGIPVEFEDFLRYTRKLKFDQCPDYAKWIETFRNLAIENGYSGKEDFIWPPVAPKVRIRCLLRLDMVSFRLGECCQAVQHTTSGSSSRSSTR
jgi:hypothetical protein